MKTKFLLLTIAAFLISLMSLRAEDEKTKESPFSFGSDLVSRYIFRSLDFGGSPAIQPYFNFDKGGFEIGAWGSYAFIATPTGIEVNLHALYNFRFGLTLVVTDYYYPFEELKISPGSVIRPVRSGNYFDYENNHLFEISATQEIDNFYLSANYGAYNMNNAVYLEA